MNENERTTMVFDWETSDMVHHNLPYNDLSQPKPVQLGAILYDGQWHPRMEVCLIIKPAGWKIQPGAQAKHGISQEQAERYGVSQHFAAMTFRQMMIKADVVATFNTAFDFKITDHWFWTLTERWRTKATGCCIMETMTDVLKLPAKYPGQKRCAWPSLDQAYAYVTRTPENPEGLTFRTAIHEAMADTRAAAKVLQWATENNAALVKEPLL